MITVDQGNLTHEHKVKEPCTLPSELSRLDVLVLEPAVTSEYSFGLLHIESEYREKNCNE